MLELLRQLRGALEYERTLHGSYLPVGVPSSTSTRRLTTETSFRPSSKSSTDEATRPSSPPTSSADERPPAATSPNGSAVSSQADSTNDDAAPMANYDLFGNQIDPSEDASLPPWERIEALIPDDSPLRDMQTLEEVEDYVSNTILIPIDENRKNPVMGTGDPNADLMIVGEAPGADEDRTGEPFTGRAGQLLNKILEAIDFEREEVYITNILKSRPPNNRDPLKDEVEAHIPILYKQIALIKPRIILAVGKTAGNSLLDRRSSLGSLRDTFHDFYGLPLMVTYHPAALLRNSQWKRPTWEDMKLLRTKYDELVTAA